MATIEQKRGSILAKRIKTINNFLLGKLGTNETFGKHLASLGINESVFFKDLPKQLVIEGISNATPSSDNLIKYGSILNLYLQHQKLIFNGKNSGVLSADGSNDYRDAIVPANYLDYNADAAKPKKDSPKPYCSTHKCYGVDSAGKLYSSANGSDNTQTNPVWGLTPMVGIDSSFVADGGVDNSLVPSQCDVQAKQKVIASGKYSGLTLENWNNPRPKNYFGLDDSSAIRSDYNNFYSSCVATNTKQVIDPSLEKSNTVGDKLKNLGTSIKKAVADTGRAIAKAGKDVGHAITHPKELLHGLNALNPITVLMRASFLSLVAINAAALASALRAIKNDGNQTHWNKIVAKWNVLGGDTNKLKSTIDNGSSKKPFPPVKKSHNADGSAEELDPNDAKNAGKTAAACSAALGALASVLASNPYTASAAVYVGSAAGLLATMNPIFKDFAKSKGEDTSGIGDVSVPDGQILDSDTAKALNDIQDGTDVNNYLPTFWDNYKWWIVGIIGLASLTTIGLIITGKKNK